MILKQKREKSREGKIVSPRFPLYTRQEIVIPRREPPNLDCSRVRQNLIFIYTANCIRS